MPFAAYLDDDEREDDEREDDAREEANGDESESSRVILRVLMPIFLPPRAVSSTA